MTPIVVAFGSKWGAETVYLPGDEPPRSVRVMVCQACTTEMPVEALFSFNEDGEEFWACVDTEACRARVKGLQETPGTHSFLMDAVTKLTDRVEGLERWRASVAMVGGEVGVPTGAPTSTVGRCVQSVPDAPEPPEDYYQTREHVMGRLGEPGVTLVRGDARMVPMDDASVDLVVTSPPYWAQRSYTDDGGTHYAGQIGDEPTYDMFIDNLIACTRDWARVLKPGGSIWVNLGDKYSTSGSSESRLSGASAAAQAQRGPTRQVQGMKPKSLLGLPWRYALRCTDELGLILREEVIWSKPNGMPESVIDRCRRSHEQWFHFVKQPNYYSAVDRIRLPGPKNALGALPPSVWESVWEVATAGLTVPEWLGVDHYAAFPMELPRRIIQGFSPASVCTVCGEGRRPVKTVTREGGRIRQKVDQRFLGKPKPDGLSPQSQDAIGAHAGYKTWHNIAGEACACTPYTDHPGVRVGVEARTAITLVPGNVPRSLGAPAQGPWREYHFEDWEAPPTRPAVVLDPFGGTGTTALVAEMNERHGVHLDMSADYLRIAEWRTTDPAQRASAKQVPKPPVEMPHQLDLFAGNIIGDDDEPTPRPMQVV